MKRSRKKTKIFFAFHLLRAFCPDQLYEEIEGDLIYKFNKDVKAGGEKRAKRRLIWNVVRFCRPGILLRNKISTYKMSSLMLSNLKIAFRQIRHQQLNTFLHVGGLSLGISVCIVIGLFLNHEWSFDRYHAKANRTYRINTLWKEAGEEYPNSGSPFVMADAMRNEFTSFEKVVRAHPISKASIKMEGQDPQAQERILITDPEFVDVFELTVLQGDAKKTLALPFHALLTRTTAQKLFGTLNVIGKTFTYREEFTITVGGLIEDFPSNTHLPANMLMSYVDNSKYLYSTNENYFGPSDWGQIYGTSTFVILNEGKQPQDVAAQLKKLADDKINSDATMGITKCSFWLQPLTDIHFDTVYSSGRWAKSVEPMWLLFFATVGLMVLFLACINFINLSTALALTRAKEVGVRKSIGAGRYQLILQFLTESFVLTFIAVCVSLVIVKLSWPSLTHLFERSIELDFWNYEFIITLLSGIVVTSLLAGMFPAWMISNHNSLNSMKRQSVRGAGGVWIRKALVIVQFTFSTSLIAAVLLIAQQVQFMRNISMGFNNENVIVIDLPDTSKIAVLENEIRMQKSVHDISFGNNPPNSENHWWTPMSLKKDDENREAVMTIWADNHYFSLYDIKLVSGRFYQLSDLDFLSDKVLAEQQVVKTVVNRSLLKALSLGTPDEAIGKIFHFGGLSGNAEIIGVVEDFKTQSVHSTIYPLMISQFPYWYSSAAVKFESGISLQESIASVENSWKKAFPEQPFEYYFLDEKMDASYKEDIRQFGLFKIIAFIAILISCLGLWGLTTFTAQQRTKEIGIRKVMGASVKAIVLLLSSDFMLLIFVSFAISVPVMIYLMNLWLSEFAYHVSVQWQLFATTGVLLFVTALLSMSIQTIRAAISNPVKSLKGE